MCPDRQIISLYIDGELPSPWQEKMEAHLQSCEKCRAALAGYRVLGERLRDLPEETVASAGERVWKKLGVADDQMPAAPAARDREWRIRPARRIWSRTVTMPLPAAAAAAVVIIIAFVALAGLRSGGPAVPHEAPAMAGIGFDDYTTIPLQDMAGVLGYLSSQDNGDFMVVRLPESRNFSRSGDPTLINAADYSRTRRSFSR